MTVVAIRLWGSPQKYGNQKTASPSTNVTFVNAPRFGGGGGGASSEEVKEMSTRVDLIFNQFKDLQKSCETFIPRGGAGGSKGHLVRVEASEDEYD